MFGYYVFSSDKVLSRCTSYKKNDFISICVKFISQHKNGEKLNKFEMKIVTTNWKIIFDINNNEFDIKQKSCEKKYLF